jgi:membrane-bound lytic murein transglycosylase B
MGLPQFMPSSWRRYAVDFDSDGHIDLWNSTADAIGSVANYFRAFEWQAGQPTTFDVRVQSSPEQLDQLLLPDILPTFSAQALQSLGLQLPPDAAHYPGKLALIELRNGEDAPSFVLGTENFYVVTRYNWSSYYAMAVIELGETIERDRQRLALSALAQ